MMLKRKLVVFVIISLIMTIFLPFNSLSASGQAAVDTIYMANRPLQTYKKGFITPNSFPYDVVNIIEVRVDEENIIADEQGTILTMKLPKGIIARANTNDITSRPNAIKNLTMIQGHDAQSNFFRFHLNISAGREDAVFYIYLYNMTVPEDYNNFQVIATFESDNSRIFTKGEVAFAYVEGGHLAVEAEEYQLVTTFNQDNYAPTLIFKENFSNAITNIELTLPKGFYWDRTVGSGIVVPESGFYDHRQQTVPFSYRGTVSGFPEAAERLTIEFSLLKEVKSQEKSSWKLMGQQLKIIINPDEARLGEVEAKADRATPATFEIATYGHQAAEAEEVTTVRLLSGRTQPLGEFKITERRVAALEKGRTIVFTLPEGLKWTSYPTISETSETNGLTLAMEQGKTKWEKVDEMGRSIRTTISKESSETAAILIFEGGEVNIDEDYEGSAEMIVRGNAGATGVVPLGNVQYLPGSKVGELSPSPGEIPMQTAGKTVVFTINQPIYKIDNQVKNALLTPYIKDGRTFLGLKDVAVAVGVKEEDILWEPVTRTITIQKEKNIIQLQLGSNIIRSNAGNIVMNTTAEVKDNRTTLPVAYIMQALDINYNWDGNSNTVTITLDK